MRTVDIIIKKRDKHKLTTKEIEFIVKGYNDNIIPDYQVSSLAMAILFNGMDLEEITTLTNAIVKTGDVIDLSKIKKPTVDKHSTGGVGDKTTLVLTPMLAAMGMAVAKLSGRGLGHTGGTVDKLESIPNFNVEISNKDFINQVNKIGMSVIGQTQSLTPADKKLYALRDVTGTVESIPLIASSIMSKKIASGAKSILLDVKVGDGAFMKDLTSATKLAKTMVGIGNNLGRNTFAMITDMSQPLGLAVGNRLEVVESIETLKGNGPADLVELCVEAAAILGFASKTFKSVAESRKKAKEVLKNGKALEVFYDFVRSQGGDVKVFDNLTKYSKAKYSTEVVSQKDGYVTKVKALTIGDASMHMGAGRATKTDIIDEFAGIVLNKKVGDKVKKGELLFTAHSSKVIKNEYLEEALGAFEFSSKKPEQAPTIIKIIK